ncbi:YraN family protein [Nodosilinea sp. P-1105]|uniref:YraN family protein n=1 Tax=Nodosilinea sp. P-1105 TaxID=2546229 RepID=UPI001F1178DE|nr:YraN family protein [Nodosilinea sp. P-1105]
MAEPMTKGELGTSGEDLVAQWLLAQGWQPLARQWHCRWGELDLVMACGPAGSSGHLTFVEVKTRSQGNWDADGLMAITRSKQAKLWKAAQLYLLKQPQWADATCRFDVALVACRRGAIPTSGDPNRYLDLADGRYLVLQDYIDCAFDVPGR